MCTYEMAQIIFIAKWYALDYAFLPIRTIV